MPFYSRNVALTAEVETSLGNGSGASITIGAAVSGVLPTAAPTVTAGGTSYPVSQTLPVRYVSSTGVATATGTVTTNGSGVITSATVTNGGGSYTNGAPEAMRIVGNDLSYGNWTGLDGSWSGGKRQGQLIGSDFTFKLNTNMIERDVLRGFMGGKELIPANTWVEMTFTTEMAPSGVIGVAPAWSLLQKGLGFAETYSITAGAVTQIAYTPVSDNFPSLSLMARFGGINATVRGARVTKMEFAGLVNGLPKTKWTVIGLLRTMGAAAFQNVDLSHWPTPLAILDSNTVDIKFGGTLSAGTGNISGGTNYPSQGLSITVDNNAKFRPFLGGDAVPITQRDTSGEVVADLTDVQRLDWYTKYQANTLESLYFGIGTTTGSKLRLWMPGVERQAPENVDDDGLLLTKQPFRGRPSWANGNDELRIFIL